MRSCLHVNETHHLPEAKPTTFSLKIWRNFHYLYISSKFPQCQFNLFPLVLSLMNMETDGNSFCNLCLLPSQWKLLIKRVSSKCIITCRRGRCTPITFMVSALARIFKGSDVLVTPSISLLISAKTWLRKMFLMYTVRKSRRGHCLAGPSPRACSISWINLEDKEENGSQISQQNSSGNITKHVWVFLAASLSMERWGKIPRILNENRSSLYYSSLY